MRRINGAYLTEIDHRGLPQPTVYFWRLSDLLHLLWLSILQLHAQVMNECTKILPLKHKSSQEIMSAFFEPYRLLQTPAGCEVEPFVKKKNLRPYGSFWGRVSLHILGWPQMQWPLLSRPLKLGWQVFDTRLSNFAGSASAVSSTLIWWHWLIYIYDADNFLGEF